MPNQSIDAFLKQAADELDELRGDGTERICEYNLDRELSSEHRGGKHAKIGVLSEELTLSFRDEDDNIWRVTRVSR